VPRPPTGRSSPGPHCRRASGFLLNLGNNPTQTCIVAAPSGKYNTFTGNPNNITQVASTAFYSTTAPLKYAWFNQLCSTSSPAICEVPIGAGAAGLSCPPAPPPLPPPLPAAPLCE
jgi:hypothetical protein